jgi:acyl-CoA synthetase (AMP-forming)/AMP-acid ligase II
MLDFSRLKSVADISRIHAVDRPGAVALDFKGRTTSFGELDAHASRVAQGLLELGLKPGAASAISARISTAISRCCWAPSRRAR